MRRLGVHIGMLLLLGLVTGPVAPSAADAGDEYLGRVESPGSVDTGIEDLLLNASDRSAGALARDCAATSRQVQTSDRLIGDVNYNMYTGRIWVGWSTPEQVAIVKAPPRCGRTIDASVRMIDHSFWCADNEPPGGIEHRTANNGYEGATNRVPGALPRVDYFYPRGVGVPCYRVFAQVTMEFRASYRTYSESGPVSPTGCVARHWQVEFYPQRVTLAPGIDWLRIGPASPESACAT